MGRKIIKSVSVIQLILAVTIYFSINGVFGNDEIIAPLLEITNITSTLLRLSIYIIPGITLICGLFGLVFSAKEILCLIAGINAVSTICLLVFLCGKTDWMYTLSYINIAAEIVYIIGIIILVRNQKK